MPSMGVRVSLFLYSLVAFSLQLVLLKTFEYLNLFSNVIEILPMGLLGLSLGTILAAAWHKPEGKARNETRALSLLVGVLLLLVPAILYTASALIVFLSILCFVALGFLIALNLIGGQFVIAYLYDLLGSITGLLLVWALLPKLGGELLFFSCLAAISLLALLKHAKVAAVFGAIALAGVITVAIVGPPPNLIWWVKKATEESGPNSSRNIVKRPGAELLATRWSLLDRVDAIRFEGGTNLYFNDRPWSNLPTANSNRLPHPPKGKSALIIGVGGGRDIAELREAGFTRILGSELSPEVMELMRGPLYEISGKIFDQAEVHGINGRTLMRKTREEFDLILSIFPERVKGGRRSHTFSENYLWTEESFADFLRLLSPNGKLVMGWAVREYSTGNARRFLATLRRGYELAGLPMQDRAVVHMEEKNGYFHLRFALKRNPFTAEEIALISKVNEGLAPVVIPFKPFAPPPDFLGPESRSVFIQTQELFSGKTGEWHRHPELSNPATDDHPFIHYVAKHALFSSFTMNCMLAILFASLLLFAFYGRNLSSLGAAPASAQLHCFFSGAFFCLIETYLIRRLNFYFGNPVQNLTFVFVALLIGAAVPAALASREKVWLGMRKFVLLAPLATIAFFLLMPTITDRLSQPVAYTLSILLIVPIGIFSSFIFPYYCRRLPESTGILYGLNLLGFFAASAMSVSFGILLGIQAIFITAITIAILQALFFQLESRQGWATFLKG